MSAEPTAEKHVVESGPAVGSWPLAPATHGYHRVQGASVIPSLQLGPRP